MLDQVWRRGGDRDDLLPILSGFRTGCIALMEGPLEEVHNAQMTIPLTFFDDLAFVSIDLQKGAGTAPASAIAHLPPLWVRAGITAEDVAAAESYLRNVALPNAVLVADACRRLGLPMVFVHWGYRLHDGMDLEPSVRAEFVETYGADPVRWPHHIDDPASRPAAAFGVRPNEYVVAKTGQDAFDSSPLRFVLDNLECQHLVFVGGHTNACLGRTAQSARQAGYATLCVTDATFAVCESWRLAHISGVYDHTVLTQEFLALAECAVQARQRQGNRPPTSTKRQT